MENFLSFRSKIVEHISRNWVGFPSVTPTKLLSQEIFAAILRIERRRVQRSQGPFVLMLLEIDVLFRTLPMDTALQILISAISTATRETDLVGWYEMGSTLGIIFAGLNA